MSPGREPGREMDAAIAEKVMGWHPWDGESDYDGPLPMFAVYDETLGLAVYKTMDDPDFYFAPSTDNATAISALEHHGNSWSISRSTITDSYHVTVWNPRATQAYKEYTGGAKTLAHAACLALLRAVGAE